MSCLFVAVALLWVLLLLWLLVLLSLSVDVRMCGCADVRTCGRADGRTVCRGRHRLTREFVVGVVVAVEIHVRACIMCRPWTQICRLFFGSSEFSNNHQDVCGNVRVRPECVKSLLKLPKICKEN